MQRVFVVILLLTVAIPRPTYAAPTLLERTQGRILLQVDSYGRAWYVNPADKRRYYLRDGNDAYQLMRELSLGVSNVDLAKIPLAANDPRDAKLVARLKGRILLQVEDRGKAWYVNPVNGQRYYLKDGAAAYELMRSLGLGVRTKDLAAIPMNDRQVVFDGTFATAAYVKLSDGRVVDGSYANTVLPLASLTKLMTALVLADEPIQWQAQVAMTPAAINYPKQMVGSDATSEIDLQVGDTVTVRDLWQAMLVASSNQAAVALVDASGQSRSAFVAKMNAKARSLGLTRTIFYDVAGLDAHNVSTASEMAKLAAAAFAVPDIATASATLNYTFTATAANGTPRQVEVTDRNYSLRAFGVDAAKTGYLVEAQRNAALKKGNDIVVVLHALSMAQRNGILQKLLN